VRYSDDGQPQCATLLDYTIPTSLDAAPLRVVLQQTPSETLGGFRGMGESGIIAAPAAIVGAVDDALRPLGVRLTSSRAHAGALRAAVCETGWRLDVAAWAARGG
jgi:carbon-monoxide dehydrogenase large subunit